MNLVTEEENTIFEQRRKEKEQFKKDIVYIQNKPSSPTKIKKTETTPEFIEDNNKFETRS